MPHEFTVIRSHIHLPKQKQDAILTRLSEAISRDPLMQGQAGSFLYEYHKQRGNEPLSFFTMLELWGWKPTFDQADDLITLTSNEGEIEDERTLHLFLDTLAPGLDDENVVELEIDHMRRRYVSLQGKMYRLDATYVYPLFKRK